MNIPWKLKSFLFGIIDRLNIETVLYFLQTHITKRARKRLHFHENWKIHKETIELVPWVTNLKSNKYDAEKTHKQKGYKKCLKELREIIELKSKTL